MKRNRFTWQNYLLLAHFAFWEAGLGLLLPFLRDELNLNYTVSGMHLSAFALGMILAGLFSDVLLERWRPQQVFWFGGSGMTLGTGVLVAGTDPLLTIFGSLLMGSLGTVTLVAIQAYLSKAYPERKATALTEANVCASVGTVAAPLIIGGLANTVIGWRGTAGVAALAFLLIMVVFRQRPGFTQADEQVAATPSKVKRRLPRPFWVLWVVLFAIIAVEWCIVFWGASFLEDVVGISKVNASLAMSTFFGAMIISRLIGSRLTLVAPSETLLLLALAIVLVGFPLFWLALSPMLSIVGLFIAGLGVANLYPMAVSTAIALAPEQDELASSRATLAVGLSMLSMPQLLGLLADQLGIQLAYGVVLFWLLVSIGITLFIKLTATPQPAPKKLG